MTVIGVIHPENAAPLWTRTADALRSWIDAGVLGEGTRLPSERDLCAEMKVSRVTIRRALSALVDDGTIVASPSRGWFVAQRGIREWPNSLESFSETARRQGLRASSVVIAASATTAAIDDAETLQVAPGSLVFDLRRVRMLDGIPVAIDRAVVPMPVAPSLVEVDFRFASLYEELAVAGVAPVEAETMIDAQAADGLDADILAIAPGAPTLVMRQLVRDNADRPVLWSVVRYAGERYRLRTSFLRGAGA